MNVVPLATIGSGNAPVLRRGTAADAERCGTIAFEAFRGIAGQHGFPPDFPDADTAIDLMTSILPREDVYSVVAELDGVVVGSNFLWENSAIASVGPITVEVAAQNGDVGHALMREVLERARTRRFAGVRLAQAAYHNRSLALYTRLGFVAREPLSTIQGPALALLTPGYPVRAAVEQDLAACNDLCVRVHGHDRGLELRDAIRDGAAALVERGGRISGYTTGLGFFGHAVAESNEDMQALIGAAPGFSGPGFLLPTRNAGLLRWCLERGLRIVQPMTLMSIGLYNEPTGVFMPSVLY